MKCPSKSISPHWRTMAVLADEVWLFGRSGAQRWDSRYFGPVPAASVRRVMRPALTVDREVPRISPTTHSREQGIRVHYLANLGGPVAVAGLDHQEPDEPDLLLGILLEVGKMRTWTLAQCDSGEPGTHPRPPSSECCILAWPLRAVRRRRDDGASVSVSNPLPPLRCSATIDEVVVRPCLDFPCRNARSCA